MSYINLRTRCLDSDLKRVLNEYNDVPVEIKRVILNGIVQQINAESDTIVRHELNEYQKEQEEAKNKDINKES